MSKPVQFKRSKTSLVWTVGTTIILHLPMSFAFDCLLIYAMYPLFFRTRFYQDDPMLVPLLALIVFGTASLINLFIVAIRTILKSFDILSGITKSAVRENWEEDLLKHLVQDSEEERALESLNKDNQSNPKSDTTDNPSEILVQFKKLPFEILRFLITLFVTKAILPDVFQTFELFSILAFSFGYAFIVTLYKIVANNLCEKVLSWRDKIDNVQT